MSVTQFPITRVQAGLVMLLHEVGKVQQQQTIQIGSRTVVDLTMTGDKDKQYRVLVDKHGQAVWKVME